MGIAVVLLARIRAAEWVGGARGLAGLAHRVVVRLHTSTVPVSVRPVLSRAYICRCTTIIGCCLGCQTLTTVLSRTLGLGVVARRIIFHAYKQSTDDSIALRISNIGLSQ